MDYVEKLIEDLNLNEQQADDLWCYAQCLLEDEGVFGDALEVELDRYLEMELDR